MTGEIFGIGEVVGTILADNLVSVRGLGGHPVHGHGLLANIGPVPEGCIDRILVHIPVVELPPPDRDARIVPTIAHTCSVLCRQKQTLTETIVAGVGGEPGDGAAAAPADDEAVDREQEKYAAADGRVTVARDLRPEAWGPHLDVPEFLDGSPIRWQAFELEKEQGSLTSDTSETWIETVGKGIVEYPKGAPADAGVTFNLLALEVRVAWRVDVAVVLPPSTTPAAPSPHCPLTPPPRHRRSASRSLTCRSGSRRWPTK